jgi:preprotein translocase subunit SecE
MLIPVNYCYNNSILVEFTVVNPISKVITYIKEVIGELKQVVWPKRDDVIKLTLIVFLFSGIVGAYLGVLDFGFTKLLEYLVSR